MIALPATLTTCPACDRHIGLVTRCPYCDSETRPRRPLIALRCLAFLLSIGGLLLLAFP